MKQINQMEYKRVKNPNWRRRVGITLTRAAERLISKVPRTNPACDQADLQVDNTSSALTVLPPEQI